MKGLRLFIPPFAPDTSGAAAALYPAGGMVLIVDAGGCAGNISAFDEPRWNKNHNSAVFSAGLRDMDAIMGRDKKLLEKIALAKRQMDIDFVALISTPVPAVIGSDLKALKKIGESELGIPIVTIDTDGTKLYDVGVSKAFLAMFIEFTKAAADKITNSIGVIGATPLDFSEIELNNIRCSLQNMGYTHIVFYGIDSGIDSYINASRIEKNIVISPAGLKSAKFLADKFNVPYEIADCHSLWLTDLSREIVSKIPADTKKILILHQQIMANALREELSLAFPQADIICGTFFKQVAALKNASDIACTEEDEFTNAIKNIQPDVIIGDTLLNRALSSFEGKYISLKHFAVSGAD